MTFAMLIYSNHFRNVLWRYYQDFIKTRIIHLPFPLKCETSAIVIVSLCVLLACCLCCKTKDRGVWSPPPPPPRKLPQTQTFCLPLCVLSLFSKGKVLIEPWYRFAPASLSLVDDLTPLERGLEGLGVYVSHPKSSPWTFVHLLVPAGAGWRCRREEVAGRAPTALGYVGFLPSQGVRQVWDVGGSWDQQQCKAGGTEVCLPMDHKAIGFASFSTHKTNCWSSSLLSSLIIQNYVRGLSCWVLPYQMFNLLVIFIYALKQRSLCCYKFLLREKAPFLGFFEENNNFGVAFFTLLPSFGPSSLLI